ncbi:MAG: DnaB-like helicase C-terminal domain-containing protein, partial [Nanoarchaeota archaeon]|nr:DnaB-like helicase C-terminal domain-containing protein [Nanoarchaeota archaeon]
RSELGVIISGTGVGKSHLLVHLGATALMLGKNVIYYTLEMADTSIGSRFDSCLTEFSINDIKLYKDLVYKKIKDIPGKLIVKEYPTKSVSIKAIRNHLDKLIQKGFNPDMVIIDYGDLLKSAVYSKERRFDLESVFEDMRALAQEYRVSVWTASQCKRDSLEKEVITMDSIAESFAKCFIADLIISLSRTIADKNSNQGRIYIAKNRNGIDGVVFPLFVDTSISKIKVLQSQNENGELITTQSSFSESGNVSKSNREKYKALIKSKKKE